MSHTNNRFLAWACAALLVPTMSASAQFVDLLTEAPVTFQLTLQSSVVATRGTSRTTKVATTRLTNVQVLEELRTTGIITDASIAGWSLVAVRSAPSDLHYVNAEFNLYAINGATRIPIPTSKFVSTAYASVDTYTEKNQGRYILSSKGTVTNHVVFKYNPLFWNNATPTTTNSSEYSGFAKVNYVTKNLSDDYEILFYSISSISVTANGGYAGTKTPPGLSPVPNNGISTLTVTVGAPKLVPASLYPNVQPY